MSNFDFLPREETNIYWSFVRWWL